MDNKSPIVLRFSSLKGLFFFTYAIWGMTVCANNAFLFVIDGEDTTKTEISNEIPLSFDELNSYPANSYIVWEDLITNQKDSLYKRNGLWLLWDNERDVYIKGNYNHGIKIGLWVYCNDKEFLDTGATRQYSLGRKISEEIHSEKFRYLDTSISRLVNGKTILLIFLAVLMFIFFYLRVFFNMRIISIVDNDEENKNWGIYKLNVLFIRSALKLNWPKDLSTDMTELDALTFKSNLFTKLLLLVTIVFLVISFT